MANRVGEIDTRSHQRVDERSRVQWKVNGGEFTGVGYGRNISNSGMLLETNGQYRPNDGTVFSFDAIGANANHVPRVGRLIWNRQKQWSHNRYQCGIEFIEPADAIKQRLQEHVQTRLTKEETAERMTEYIQVWFTLGVILLTAFSVWVVYSIYKNNLQSQAVLFRSSDQQAFVSRSYARQYREAQAQLTAVTAELEATKALYQESQKILDQVNLELTETKSVLAQTQGLLSQAHQELEQHKITSDEQLKALQRTIAMLEDQNRQLNQDIVTLEEQVRYFSGNVKNIKEGKDLLALYKANAKVVKARIQSFEREAKIVKWRADEERDRIRLILGNNGYFVKDGQAVVVDEAKYKSATLSNPAQPATPNQNIKVDVQFVE